MMIIYGGSICWTTLNRSNLMCRHPQMMQSKPGLRPRSGSTMTGMRCMQQRSMARTVTHLQEPMVQPMSLTQPQLGLCAWTRQAVPALRCLKMGTMQTQRSREVVQYSSSGRSWTWQMRRPACGSIS